MRQVTLLLLLPALTAALQLSGFDFSLLPSLAGTPIPSKVPPSALHLSSNSSSSSANGGISTEPLSCFTRDVYFLVLDGVVLTRDSGFNRRLYNNGTHSDVAAVALFLVALGVAATLLLLAGEYLGRFSVFLVALLIFFLLLLGLIGGTTAWYSESIGGSGRGGIGSRPHGHFSCSSRGDGKLEGEKAIGGLTPFDISFSRRS